MPKKQSQVGGSLPIALIEPLELRSANHGIDLGASHVISRKREYKIGIQIGAFVHVIGLADWAIHFPDHAMPAKHRAV